MIRVLSLYQSLATLHVAGFKMIETRSFSTKYRGRVAIHASARFPPKFARACFLDPFATHLAHLGYNTPEDLPTGAIVGWVTLTDCLEMRERVLVPGTGFQLRGFGGTERDYGIYQPGRFAWITSGPRCLLDKPIPFKGSLGLRWLPPEVEAQIENAAPRRPAVIASWNARANPRV